MIADNDRSSHWNLTLCKIRNLGLADQDCEFCAIFALFTVQLQEYICFSSIFLIFVNMFCVEICVHIVHWKSSYLNIFVISILQLREKYQAFQGRQPPWWPCSVPFCPPTGKQSASKQVIWCFTPSQPLQLSQGVTHFVNIQYLQRSETCKRFIDHS